MQNDNRQHVKCRRGFTLVELILVVGTIGLVTGALVGVVGNSYKDFKAGSDRSTALQDGQAAIDQITRLVREAKSISKITDKSNKTGYIEFQDADGITKRIERNSTTNELKYGKPGRLSTLFGNATHLYITGYKKSGSTTTTTKKIRALQFDLTLKDASSPFVSRVSLPIDHPIIEPDTGPQYTYPDSENRHYTLPVACYKLDAPPDGGNRILDSSGDGNHGVRVNGPDYVTGKFGEGLYFDGSNDYVKVTVRSRRRLANLSKTATVTLWTKGRNQPSDNYTFIAYGGSKSIRSFFAHIPWGNKVVMWYCGNENNAMDKLAKGWGGSYNSWNHWAFTKDKDDKKMQIYINGSRHDWGGNRNKTMPGVNELRLGNRKEGDRAYSGTIDDFRIYNWVLSKTQIGTVKAGNAFSSPVLWFKFEDPTLVAMDNSGNENHGTLTGPPEIVPGRIGDAYSFDGAGPDYVEIDNFKGVTGKQSRTMTAWIKTTGSGAIMSWGENITGKKWIFRVEENKGALRVEVNYGYIIGTTALSDDAWHHVAAVLSNDGSPDVTEVKLYVDGVQEDISAELGRSIDTGIDINVMIGTSPHVPPMPFTGLIDDVRIYDVALSGPEIAALCFEWKEAAVE